jgi:hypothetical protein
LIARGFIGMNIEFPRDLENKKKVLKREMKETNMVQNVISVLTIVMHARIVQTSRVMSQQIKKHSILL